MSDPTRGVRAVTTPAVQSRGRAVEDGLAILGGGVVALYVIAVEILPHVVAAVRGVAPIEQSHGLPWGVIFLAAICVAPKTIGRASAGKAWEALADGLARRIGGRRSTDVPPAP